MVSQGSTKIERERETEKILLIPPGRGTQQVWRATWGGQGRAHAERGQRDLYHMPLLRSMGEMFLGFLG